MAGTIQIATGTAPANPGAGYVDIYADAGNSIHVLTSAGSDKTVATTDIVLVTGNITDAAITSAKLANMAEATIKGRATAGTGVPEDLTAAQVATILAAYLPGTTDAAWTAPTLATYWVSAATVYPAALNGYTPSWSAVEYRKVGGVVYLHGHCHSTSNGASATIATLPVGYRPPVDAWFPSYYSNSTSTLVDSWILIKSTGDVFVPTVANNTSWSFDHIVFVPA